MLVRNSGPLLSVLALSSFVLAGCGGSSDGGAPVSLDTPEVAGALVAIEADAIEHHIGVLAHASLAGRAPGTPGYEGGARYAEEALQSLGLKPAGEDGTYRQAVPLRHSTVVESASGMTITNGGGATTMQYDRDFYLGADPLRETVEIEDAGVVFVGFGVSAPDLG